MAQYTYTIDIEGPLFSPLFSRREHHALAVAESGRVRGRDRRVLRALVRRLRARGWVIARGRFG